ncbi:putative methyltransferase C20orf7, mitochondrial [Gossypium arboreum]|uniref:Putative methyltransferase C20orf7, mitochondrial n=1 Tax=Gossypium arboreum TaxID=29729 RepID=A0A0B0MM01_GOSAR|nr:putative methyltransferase C20orf7, mitochondrial [Gossypium arboreum]
MGFNKVFQCLQDIFPQVDSRILKAVAIENSKDVDAAAEIVLSEIIPYLSKRTAVASSSLQNQSHRIEPNEDAAIEEEESNQLRRRKVSVGKGTSSSTEPLLETGEVVGDTCLTDSSSNVDSLEAQSAATTSKFHDNNNNKAADIETEELILLGNTEIQKSKSSFSWNAAEVDNSLLYANLETKELGSSSQDRTTDIEDGFPRTPQVAPFTSVDDTAPLLENGSSNDKLNFDGSVDLNEDLCRISSLNGTMVGEENAVSMLVPSYSQEQLPESFVGLKSQQGYIGEMSDVEDETFNPVVSRSSQTCRIDLLEEIIEDAKDNKTMQSIMDLMKEVELQEAAAEQAKEEAARGGMDILVKVEELKQMLPHAKEANDMMRQTLEARQSAAQELMKAAEQEKLEKEESARNALAEQEAIMVKVVEESKILRQEAEENSKLREFLMDRGQIIDSLQGEISVICEDIRLLKQKFDDRIPLSKSISSSQTSCILASSGSSLKSRSTDLGSSQWETAKTPEKRSPTPSVDGQSPKSRSLDERSKVDGKELSDDGWEIFDKDAEF